MNVFDKIHQLQQSNTNMSLINITNKPIKCIYNYVFDPIPNGKRRVGMYNLLRILLSIRILIKN